MDVTGTAYDFIQGAEQSTSAEALLSHFVSLAAVYGVTSYAVAELANPYQSKRPAAPFFATTYWPAGWGARWMSQNYILDDPVVFYTINQRSSFFWSDIRPYQRDLGARIMDECQDFGLRDGVCVPVHRSGALPGSITLASTSSLDLGPDEGKLLQLCAFQLYEKLEELMRPTPIRLPKLSKREREALHWIAAGKPIPTVADILCLSDHTVRDHVKSAMRKLNASTQAQAIAIAIRTGELLP